MVGNTIECHGRLNVGFTHIELKSKQKKCLVFSFLTDRQFDSLIQCVIHHSKGSGVKHVHGTTEHINSGRCRICRELSQLFDVVSNEVLLVSLPCAPPSLFR